MSLSKTITTDCPYCGSGQSLTVHSSVNVTIDPGLKPKVLNGTINDNNCTSCGKTISVVTALLYHDMEGRYIISLNTSDEEDFSASAENPFQHQPGYIVREVYNYPALLEKITIFDNKLNDLAIDKIADQYRDSFREMLGHELNVFFKTIESGFFRKKIVYNCFSHPEQIMQLEQPLNKIEKPLREALYNIDALRNP